MRFEYSSRKKNGGRRCSDCWLSLGEIFSYDIVWCRLGDCGTDGMEGAKDELGLDNVVGDEFPGPLPLPV